MEGISSHAVLKGEPRSSLAGSLMPTGPLVLPLSGPSEAGRGVASDGQWSGPSARQLQVYFHLGLLLGLGCARDGLSALLEPYSQQ